jgi:hypothetical protein
MSPIKDIIITQRKSGNQTHYSYYVIFHKMPEFLYEEIKPRHYQAEVCGMYSAFEYRPGSKDAFAGRKMSFKLKDGTVREFQGDHWDVPPIIDDQMCHIGYQTIEGLRKCHVFYGTSMKWSVIQEWLKHNKPKDQYYFYEGFPTQEECYEKQKEWEEENGHFHHALKSMEPALRIHCLMTIEKELNKAKQQHQYVYKNKQSVERDYIKLLAHLIREDGSYGNEEELTDFLDNLAKESGADIDVDYSDIWEELQ